MDFIRSKKDQDPTIVSGILAAGETVWECTKRRNAHPCDATVKSLNVVIVPPVFPGDHDHPPDPDEIEVLRARSAMKRRAQDTAEPNTSHNKQKHRTPATTSTCSYWYNRVDQKRQTSTNKQYASCA